MFTDGCSNLISNSSKSYYACVGESLMHIRVLLKIYQLSITVWMGMLFFIILNFWGLKFIYIYIAKHRGDEVWSDTNGSTRKARRLEVPSVLMTLMLAWLVILWLQRASICRITVVQISSKVRTTRILDPSVCIFCSQFSLSTVKLYLCMLKVFKFEKKGHS